jgi:uncharacterized CHY-type Zn-finger protein
LLLEPQTPLNREEERRRSSANTRKKGSRGQRSEYVVRKAEEEGQRGRERERQRIERLTDTMYISHLALTFYSKHILNAQVSIRAPCCRQFFDCPQCHYEKAGDHELMKTTEMTFICKKCKKAFRKQLEQFEDEDEFCPHCDNHYVSGCGKRKGFE